jgi:hypothetical protein
MEGVEEKKRRKIYDKISARKRQIKSKMVGQVFQTPDWPAYCVEMRYSLCSIATFISS